MTRVCKDSRRITRYGSPIALEQGLVYQSSTNVIRCSKACECWRQSGGRTSAQARFRCNDAVSSQEKWSCRTLAAQPTAFPISSTSALARPRDISMGGLRSVTDVLETALRNQQVENNFDYRWEDALSRKIACGICQLLTCSILIH